jgi:Second Messenger Oligonucleotide or Dinucleotide Synthetase domain
MSEGTAIVVSKRFSQFVTDKLPLTTAQRLDGTTKRQGICSCLNRHYYGVSLIDSNYTYVGSWGKSTQIRPPRDVDILFVLPDSVFYRFEQRAGNKQSQLLQEVKTVLGNTYSSTKMRGDGQVVVVPFDSYAVEVVPAFKVSGQYLICDTNEGGKYKTFDPIAEAHNIDDADRTTNGNVRHLVRMMKRWQNVCFVPLKSFWLELLAVKFLSTWAHKDKSTFYYDWMVRDFFQFLTKQANGYDFVPGTYEIIYFGDAWKSKAESAFSRAEKATDLDYEGSHYLANNEWEKIFGPDIKVFP